MLLLTFILIGLTDLSFASKRQAEDQPTGDNKRARTGGYNSSSSSSSSSSSFSSSGQVSSLSSQSYETKLSPIELKRILVEEPKRIHDSADLQNLLVHYICMGIIKVDNALCLFVSQVLPNLDEQALNYDKYAYTFLSIKKLDNDVIPSAIISKIHERAEQVGAFAQLSLGFLFQNGWLRADGSRHAPNMDKAVELYTKSAEQGNSPAQYNLGVLFKNGWVRADGSRQAPNIDKAVELYTKSAEQGNYNAQNNLGVFFKNGWVKADGSRQAPNMDKAVECFTKANYGREQAARPLLQILLEIMKSQAGNVPIAFNVSQVAKEKIDNALIQLEGWAAQTRSSSSSSFSDVSPHPLMHKYFKTIAEDLRQFNALIEFLNKPGFLLTCIQPKFNISDTISDKPYLGIYHVGSRFYSCLGHENNDAANKLIPLLAKMKSHHDLDMLQIIFEGYKSAIEPGDKEYLESWVDSIKEIEKIKTNFEELSAEIYEAIKTHSTSRNKIFEDKLGI